MAFLLGLETVAAVFVVTAVAKWKADNDRKEANARPLLQPPNMEYNRPVERELPQLMSGQEDRDTINTIEGNMTIIDSREAGDVRLHNQETKGMDGSVRGELQQAVQDLAEMMSNAVQKVMDTGDQNFARDPRMRAEIEQKLMAAGNMPNIYRMANQAPQESWGAQNTRSFTLRDPNGFQMTIGTQTKLERDRPMRDAHDRAEARTRSTGLVIQKPNGQQITPEQLKQTIASATEQVMDKVAARNNYPSRDSRPSGPSGRMGG